MASCDIPVCLTRSAPFEIHPRQMAIYDVIDVSVTDRCSVLSTIAEAGGDARLPDAITMSDFKQWLTFVQGNKREAKEMPFSGLCTVVKVADALDDRDVNKFILFVALSLWQHARSHRSSQVIQGVTHSLSRLTERVQHRVFAAAASDAGRLCSLLAFLPSHFHTAVVEASGTPSNPPQVRLRDGDYSVLQQIAALPASAPSILALEALDDTNWHGGMADAPPGEARLQIAKHLARALHRHSGLTSLTITSRHINPASAKTFLPAIAALTSIQSLRLSLEQSSYPAESVAMLHRILPNLRHLKELMLKLSEPMPESPGTLKRPRDEDASPATYCLTTALSPATALTSLHISIPDDPDNRCIAASTPLTLPHLSHLSAVFGHNHELTTAFLQHLTAPLTALTLVDDPAHDLPPTSSDDALGFLRALAKFTQLATVTAALPTDFYRATPGNDLGLERVDVAVLDLAQRWAPPILASFRHLHQLHLAAESPVLDDIIPRISTSLSALTCLALRFVLMSESHDDLPWSDFCSSLCQLPLQDLDLHSKWHITGGPGIAALQPLTQLSALRVNGWQCLEETADCQALASMASLRRVCITDCFTDDTPYDTVVRALMVLPALTHLTVEVDTMRFEEQLAFQLREHGPTTVFHALRELSVDIEFPVVSAENLVKLAAWLPALKTLSLKLRRQTREKPEVESACRHIAREAGIQLVLQWPPQPANQHANGDEDFLFC